MVGLFAANESNPVSSRKVKDKILMGEIYEKMKQLMEHQVEDMKEENSQKESKLRRRDEVAKKQLEESSEYKVDTGKCGVLLNKSLLSGDIEIQRLSMPTGRNLGPGCYGAPLIDSSKKIMNTHNIMGNVEFQLASKRSSSGHGRARSSEKGSKSQEKEDYGWLMKSMKEGCSCSEFSLTAKKSTKKGSKAKNSSAFQLYSAMRKGAPSTHSSSVLFPATGNESTVASQNGGVTANESYEQMLSHRHEKRKMEISNTQKNIEKIKQIVKESQELSKREEGTGEEKQVKEG